MFGNIVPTGASQFLRQIVRSYNAVKKEERPFKIHSDCFTAILS